MNRGGFRKAEKITDIPGTDVKRIIQDFKSEGAKVEVELAEDWEKFTVIATFPIDWERASAAAVVFMLWNFSGLMVWLAWYVGSLELRAAPHAVIVAVLVPVSFVTFFLGSEILRREFNR